MNSESDHAKRTTSERHTEILNAIRDGVEKDIKEGVMHHLSLTGLDEWEYGRAAVAWEIDPRFRNYDGSLFGGYIAAMADRIFALATFTVLHHNDERFRTTQLQTQFWRPVFGDRLRAEGRVINRSARLIHLEADFHDEHDKVCARATAVQMIVKGPAAR